MINQIYEKDGLAELTEHERHHVWLPKYTKALGCEPKVPAKMLAS